MFQFVQKHQKMIQGILMVLFIPFMFSGVNMIAMDNTSNDTVAKVGSYEISQRMFDIEFQAYKAKLAEQMGEQYDEAQSDSFEVRQAYLNKMIDEAVLSQTAQKEYLSVSDGLLQQSLLQDPSIPKNAQGQVDFAQYQEVVKARGQTASQFEDEARAEISAIVVKEAASFGNRALPLQQAFLQKLFAKVQLIEQKNIDPTPFVAAANIAPDAAEKYYQAHTEAFNRAAAFDVEYAVLSPLPPNYVPTDDEIKAAFGADATAKDIAAVRSDPVKLKQATEKAAVNKLETVAKSVIEATASAPKDLKALVAKFGGQIETVAGVTRKGSSKLPAPLQSAEIRDSLTNSEMAASNAIGSPLAYGTNLLIGRVIKSNAAGVQPFESVKAEIEAKLKQESAWGKMREEAEKQAATMNASSPIGAMAPIGFLFKHNLSTVALSQVMMVDAYPKLIVSSGSTGVTIVRVVSAAPPVPAEQAELKSKVLDWQGLSVELQRRAFLQALRQKYEITLFPERLGGRDNPSVQKKA